VVTWSTRERERERENPAQRFILFIDSIEVEGLSNPWGTYGAINKTKQLVIRFFSLSLISLE
jgi:hypothetical protein